MIIVETRVKKKKRFWTEHFVFRSGFYRDTNNVRILYAKKRGEVDRGD